MVTKVEKIKEIIYGVNLRIEIIENQQLNLLFYFVENRKAQRLLCTLQVKGKWRTPAMQDDDIVLTRMKVRAVIFTGIA